MAIDVGTGAVGCTGSNTVGLATDTCGPRTWSVSGSGADKAGGGRTEPPLDSAINMVEATGVRMALGARKTVVARAAAGMGQVLAGLWRHRCSSSMAGAAGRLAAIGDDPGRIYGAVGAAPLSMAIDVAGGAIAGAGIYDCSAFT